MKTIVLLCILGVAFARPEDIVQRPVGAVGAVRTDVESQTQQQIAPTTQTTPVSIPIYAHVESKVPHHEIKQESHLYQYPISQLPNIQHKYQYPISYQYPIESQVNELYSKLFSILRNFPYLFPEEQYGYPVDMHKGVLPYFHYPYYKQYEGMYDYPFYKHLGSQYTYPYAQYEYPKYTPYYHEYSQVLRTPYVHEQIPVQQVV